MGDFEMNIEPQKFYENTYIVKPLENERFPLSTIKAIATKHLQIPKETEYKHVEAKALAKKISDEIRKEVKLALLMRQVEPKIKLLQDQIENMEPSTDPEADPEAAKEKLTAEYEALKAAFESKNEEELKRLQRYKIVVQTYVGALDGQGMHLASRCLWDKEVDNFVSASMYNNSLYAVAMVYGCYYD